MQEPTQHPPSPSGRRPRFKSRAPNPGPSEAQVTEDTPPHEPPPPENSLSLPTTSGRVTPTPIRLGATLVPVPRMDQPLLLTRPTAVKAEPVPFSPQVPATDPASATPPPSIPPLWARQESSPRPARSFGRQLLTGALLLTVGVAGGYWLGGAWPVAGTENRPSAIPAPLAAAGDASRPGLPGERLTPTAQAALDAAFSEMKSDQAQHAREQFGELLKQHPGWSSLALEQARAALYQRDGTGARSLIDEGEKSGRINPADAAFLIAVLRMTASDYPAAAQSFERAAAADPTRADIFYFWGECLRRLGKPAEAADRFQSAVVRNQYETADGLYQLKLWLAQIQANTDATSGAAGAIDAAVALPHPRGYALAALAAREIRGEQFAKAAEHLRKAAESIDPPVFHVILQDPTFAQESWRPEFAEFFPPAPPGAKP